MTDEMADFRWSFSSAGYRWVNSGASEKVLSLVTPSGGYQYQPLRHHTGLFRTFADTEPSETGILKFANKYGPLGQIPQEPFDGESLFRSETLRVWASEIQDMKRGVVTWDAARAGDTQKLSGMIHWAGEGPNRVIYDDRPDYAERPNDPASLSYFAEIASSRQRPDVLASWRPPTKKDPVGEVIRPAVLYVQSIVNEKLKTHGVVARVLFDARDRAGERLTVHIVPTTLIGFLWLQFAKALEGRAYRQCDNCRLWFEVGGSRTSRSDKKFCTPTCKAGFHRKERERAMDLRSGGKSAVQIAKLLGKDIELVKGWLKRGV